MCKLSILFVLFFSASLATGCATPPQAGADEYDVLGSAVSASSYAIIGEYGVSVPDNLTVKEFLAVSEKNVPKSYFSVLKKYRLEVKPMGSYYLLLVYAPGTDALILFDYSCTPQPDGMVLRNPSGYDTNDLDRYDPCKEKRQRQ
jgi:hypothetical protein